MNPVRSSAEIIDMMSLESEVAIASLFTKSVFL
jgi:hypothetical protein